ncbi:MAG: baseplate J/gp47 family protein [Deltaproteobacteria bacterium]|nr:baseplate J/gp47 family protein [Deltaproteobacteria bacterium]
MADFPSRDDLVQIGKDEITSGNSQIDPSAVDIKGHPANIIVHTGASMAEEVARQGLVLERAQYLDTAGDVSAATLDELIWDRYGLVRQGATPSVGEVRFSRPTAGYGAITVSAGTVLVSTGGVRFQTTADASFGAAATGPVTAPIRSVQSGAGQKATAGTITAFEAQVDDTSVVVTNPEGTAGDADAESNTEFVARARNFFPAAAKGTLPAIEYGAKQVDGVAFAVATEVTEPDGAPARYIKLQVADKDGASSSALTDAVALALREWRCGGMRVEVIGATVTKVAITIAIITKSGFDPAAVADQVKAAIVAALDALGPGETLYYSTIVAAAQQVPGAIVPNDAVTAPATALQPDDGEVFRTELGLITVTSP